MRRHPLDPLSLVFGLVFLVLAAAALVDVPPLPLLSMRWLLPTIGIVLGVALLSSALRGDPDEE